MKNIEKMDKTEKAFFENGQIVKLDKLKMDEKLNIIENI